MQKGRENIRYKYYVYQTHSSLLMQRGIIPHSEHPLLTY